MPQTIQDLINVIDEAQNLINRNGYKFYTFDPANQKITGGWEYKDDAIDHAAEVKDSGGKVKVLTAAGLKKLRIDPLNNAFWGNPSIWE